MSNPMVTVVGPHGRHIEVHESTQKALPDAFPLPKTPTSASKKPTRKSSPKRPSTKRIDEPETEVPDEPIAPASPATADEIDTVDTTKEAR